MDDAALAAKLDRLIGLPGNAVTGLPVTVWAQHLEAVDRDLLMRAVIEVVKLLIPGWLDERSEDRRPERAIEAAEAWLANKTPEALGHAKATAKACTAARSESFGFRHRVAEAARGVAWTAGARDSSHLFDALASAEADLLARVALTGEYHLIPDQRRAIVLALKRVLIVPAPVVKVEVEAPAGPDLTKPVPYSAAQRFAVGQHLTHPKFGAMVVTAADATLVEVQLADGSKKRLAHRPA